MTIEVKNDEMLGRTNNTTLHIELIKLQQENQQLKNNWKELKKYIETERMEHFYPSPMVYDEILNKMQKLED